MKTTQQTVLITGGTRGIGLAFAEKFLQAGNQVIITGRNAEALAKIQAKHPSIKTAQADMGNLDDLKQLVAQHPGITVLINNAGVQYNYSFTDSDDRLATIRSEIQINLTGLIELTHLYIPHLSRHRESAIVNLSSSLGFVPKENAPVYCATKSAVHTFSRALRWQLESTPIKVFEVVPPLVDTDMTKGRGDNNKIAPSDLVDEFWRAFQANQTHIPIGKAKILLRLNRWLPSVAERIIRKG